MYNIMPAIPVSRIKAPAVCLMAVCLVLIPLASLADWFPSGRVTHDPAGSVTSMNNAWCVAGDDSGAFHIVWEDSRDGNAEVYYKYYDGFGWSADLRLSALGYDSSEPAVAAAYGKVHVVWSDRRDGYTEIYYRRYDGTEWGPETRLTVSAAESCQPSVCAADGRVHVTWIDSRTGTREVYYKCWYGIGWTPDERISATSGTTFQPSVVAEAGARVHIAWYDYALAKRAVYYAYFNGSVWEPQEHITTDSFSSQNPSIAVDDSGRVHLVWQDQRDLDFEIYYKCRDDSGWSDDHRLTSSAGLSQNPSVTMGGDGFAHVVWQDYRTGSLGIYYMAFDGVYWSAPVALSDMSRSAMGPSIGAGSDYEGVVWYENLDGNSEIFWARTYEGPFDPPQVVSAVPDSAMTNEIVHGLEICGNGFMFPDSVWLEKDGEPRALADSVVVVSAGSIVCRLDLHGIHYGAWDIVVKNPDGQTARLDSGFTVMPLPDGPYIESVSPNSAITGAITGYIDMLGVNFIDPVSVWFTRNGETGPEAFDESVESAEWVTFRMDLGGVAPGEYDVVIQNPDGVADTLAGGFTVLPGWSATVRLTDDPGDSRLPRTHARCIAAGAGGRLHVVWYDSRHGDPEIYYKRHNTTTWESNQRLTNSTGLATDPAIAAGSPADLHVVWTDTRNGYEQIYYLRYSEGAWGSATRLTAADDDARTPAVATDAGGDVHVVWCDRRDGTGQIYYMKCGGAVWGPEVNLSLSAEPCSEPSIAVDGLGTIHVAWVAGVSQMEVYHIANDGTWGSVTQLSNAWLHVRTPNVYATGTGRVLVAWREEIENVGHEIYLREYDGAAWQAFEEVTDMGSCGQPSIVADEDGNIHLTCRLYYVSGRDLYYKMYDGAAWSSSVAITDHPSWTDKASLALDPENNVHMVWEDDKDGDFDIYYAYRDSPGLAGVSDGDPIVKPRVVLQVAPNPVIGETALRFTAASAGPAAVSIYDIRGRRVWNHDAGDVGPGMHTVRWARRDDSGNNLSPGIYFARLELGGTVSTAKLVVLK